MGTPKVLRQARQPAAAGFTLMELLIVITLAALVLAIGAPSFTEFRRNNRLTGTANDLLASIQLSRSEAIKRQRNVTLCASLNPRDPDATCAESNLSGWIVFEDTNGNCTREAGEQLLRAEGPIDAALHGAADGTCISFNDTGFRRDLAPGVAVTHLLFCDDRGLELQAGTEQTAARGIELSRTGRAQINRDPGIVRGWGLTCP
jgi:type IV fimbrial biogenesis protein FimT